jgi:hypothetical protein
MAISARTATTLWGVVLVLGLAAGGLHIWRMRHGAHIDLWDTVPLAGLLLLALYGLISGWRRSKRSDG